ncbi:DUF4376 domain-containing protein [Vibrio sp. ER1A]|uniref:DUF4376 domain-containing protein n=1 Tax=Vibrio sp. ER1A TaxID=1517681 RepID=UPI0004DD3DAF|nr:DUF4376 domain-containing protein [Vibrio sp. ER1A]KFA99479.1 hypothetical protein HW45_03725 [Vibrio sp. ER1A]
MNIIDTEYKSLAEIDAEIVRFYREDKRTRTIGYDEEKDIPIEEEYIVIVLEKPNEVHYDYVSEKRGDRFGWDFVRGILEQAIAWEDFYVNHDLYLLWKKDYEDWEVEQPFEEDEDGDRYVIDSPERPIIDLAVRRAVYQVEVDQFDSNLATKSGLPTISFDDDNYIKHIVPTTTPKSTEEISNYHRENANKLRETMKLANIFVHGHYFQVRQDDRNNMDETIAFAKRNDRMGETTPWITADNQPITLTFHQVEAIKDAYVLRMADLFQKYAAWVAGDMQKPFVFMESNYE